MAHPAVGCADIRPSLSRSERLDYRYSTEDDMKISELVSDLEKLRVAYGDMDVFYVNNDLSYGITFEVPEPAEHDGKVIL
jgi:beta-galactosidase beta subunit